MNPLNRQIGGFHYKHYPIQPVEFITRNGLGFLEGCIIKRLIRYQHKDGLEDLEKARHELDLLINFYTQHLEEEEIKCENSMKSSVRDVPQEPT